MTTQAFWDSYGEPLGGWIIAAACCAAVYCGFFHDALCDWLDERDRRRARELEGMAALANPRQGRQEAA